MLFTWRQHKKEIHSGVQFFFSYPMPKLIPGFLAANIRTKSQNLHRGFSKGRESIETTEIKRNTSPQMSHMEQSRRGVHTKVYRDPCHVIITSSSSSQPVLEIHRMSISGQHIQNKKGKTTNEGDSDTNRIDSH